MSWQNDAAGSVQSLLERLVKFRLPWTLATKQRVDGGERCSECEIAFPKHAPEGAQDGNKLVERNPEFRAPGAQIVQLYDEIFRRAVENEKGA